MLSFLAVLAGQAATPVPAANEAALQADLRCIAALSYVVSQTTDPIKKTQVGAGVLYYVGRIEGRRPGYDMTAGMVALAGDDAAFRAIFPAELQRCGAEVQAVGISMQTLGTTLQSLSKDK